jgi:lysophospholipid acyltransferase (LPLAT)-like uncharacterized protein
VSSSKKKPPLLSRIFYSKPALWITGYVVRLVCSALFFTVKVQIHGTDVIKKASEGKLIIALWHDLLFLAPLIRKALKKTPLAVVVSNSRDGKLLASYVTTYSNTTPIFVAHDLRHTALLQMVEAIDQGKAILITPDGPRGPRHIVKPGIFYTQEKSQARIIAMHWQATNYWKLNTWDRMQIPKPFSTIEITFQAVNAMSVEDLESKLSGP